jgi:hypothetical protein
MLDKNLYENEDPMWRIHMMTLMKRKKNMEIVQIIDECLFKYYSEKGMSVPKWKLRKDPEWWIQYLKDVGEE